jgi:hypothetical protein
VQFTDAIKNDNNIFRLHYKATVIFLVTFATLVSLNQYVGDPIDCFIDGSSNKKLTEGSLLDTYCWIHSTYTLPNNPGNVKSESKPLPGLGTPKEGELVKYHKYYQVRTSQFVYRFEFQLILDLILSLIVDF